MLLAFGPESKGRHIAQVDAFALHSPHFNIAQLLNLLGFGIEGQGEFARPVIDLPNRNLRILAPNRLDHLHHGQPTSREFRAIDIDHDLAFHATDNLHIRHAGQRGVLIGQGIVGIVIQLIRGQGTL